VENPVAEFQYIPLDNLSPNPLRPRSSVRHESLLRLAESIRQWGVLVPLMVAKTPAGYQIISGERRAKAAKIAGLRTIPCLVMEIDPLDLPVLFLVEHLEKENLSLLDMAGALDKILKESKMDLLDLSKKIALDQQKILDLIKVLDLPDKIKKLYLAGKIGQRVLIKLAKDPNPLAITGVLNEVGVRG